MFGSKQEILLATSVIFSLSAVQSFIALAIGIVTLIHVFMKAINDFPEFRNNWSKIKRINKIILTILVISILVLVGTIIFFFG